MTFSLPTLIKLISKSSTVAGTVNNLIKQYNAYKHSQNNSVDYQKSAEMQAALIENFKNEIYVLHASVDSVRRSVKTLSILAAVGLMLSVAAIVISIL